MLRQRGSQLRGIVIGIKVCPGRRCADGFNRQGRRTKGILIGGQLDHGHTRFALSLANGFAGHVVVQRADAFGDQIENRLAHGQ